MDSGSLEFGPLQTRNIEFRSARVRSCGLRSRPLRERERGLPSGSTRPPPASWWSPNINRDVPLGYVSEQGNSQGGKGGKFSTFKRAVSTHDLPDVPGFHLNSHLGRFSFPPPDPPFPPAKNPGLFPAEEEFEFLMSSAINTSKGSILPKFRFRLCFRSHAVRSIRFHLSVKE